MRRTRVVAGIVAAVVVAAGMVVVPVLVGTASAATQTIAIGVDHAPPAGHNFEYVDFFPRSGVSVHTGDTLDFQWANTPDGLHTATLLKTGETPAQKWQANPLGAPDTSDTNQLQFNPANTNPTNPPAGSGAPGSCGDATTPCAFDGSSDLNSGANATNGTSHFVVHVTAASGTYDIVCLIHPGMAATISVGDPASTASTPADVVSAADAQATSDTNGALAVEAAAPPAQVQTNASGTHQVTLTAGTATPFVEVAEMLPQNASVSAGDTVKWTTATIKDPHTVTFPQGSDPRTEPIPAVCEGTPDTPLTGPPGPTSCGGDPTKIEVHLNPAPSGGTVISSPATVASSGIIGNPPAPFPTNYSFTLPNAGTYTYQCRIHDHMIGTVTVLAAAVTAPAPPATPVAGRPSFTG